MGGKGGNVMRDNLDYERKDYLEKETIKKKRDGVITRTVMKKNS